jgi:hypothetical protein
MKTKIPHLILAGLFASATALPAAATYTLVQWGESGGTTGIISANQVGTDDQTYDGGTDNPTVGASYYPSATDRNPEFNVTTSTSGFSTGIDNDTTGSSAGSDNLVVRMNTGGVAQQAMVSWTDGTHMTSPSLSYPLHLDTFTLEGKRRNSGTSAMTLQFMVQDSLGQWHISQSFSSVLSDDYVTVSESASDLTWNLYTPFVAGSDSIGAASTPDLTDVNSVGYYVDHTSTAVGGLRVRYFQVTAVPEPSSTALLGLGSLALMLRRKRS